VRVWVTGAGGFVGQRLVRRLRAEGAIAIASDREVDVVSPASVEGAVAAARPDAVVHLAALSFVPDSVARPDAAFRVNYLGTNNVLRAVQRHAPGARVLLVSSAHIYGSTPPDAPPFDEAAPLRPGSPYARSKAAADLLGGIYAERGLDVVRLRPFNHTGAGRPDHFAESSFARQLAEMERGLRPARLAVGNLDAIRDFLHVEDVVDAYWRLLQPGAPAGVFNVASGRGTSLRRVLELLLQATRLRPELRVEPDRWRPADASVGDAARLRAATGWAPKRELADTLVEILDAWRQQLTA